MGLLELSTCKEISQSFAPIANPTPRGINGSKMSDKASCNRAVLPKQKLSQLTYPYTSDWTCRVTKAYESWSDKAYCVAQIPVFTALPMLQGIRDRLWKYEE